MTMRNTYIVSGMHCEHCVQTVTTEVSKLPGVRAVDIELTSGRVAVEADTSLDIEAVRAAVDEAGYELAGANDHR